MADINYGQILEGLNGKADRDLNNTVPQADYIVKQGGGETIGIGFGKVVG